MAKAEAIGSSGASAGAAAVVSAGLSGCLRAVRQARAPAPKAMAAKGARGMPGTMPITPAAAETMPRLTGLVASCSTMALSAEPSTPDLETRKPAAIEMTRAGTWLTRPSPMVRTV